MAADAPLQPGRTPVLRSSQHHQLDRNVGRQLIGKQRLQKFRRPPHLLVVVQLEHDMPWALQRLADVVAEQINPQIRHAQGFGDGGGHCRKAGVQIPRPQLLPHPGTAPLRVYRTDHQLLPHSGATLRGPTLQAQQLPGAGVEPGSPRRFRLPRRTGLLQTLCIGLLQQRSNAALAIADHVRRLRLHHPHQALIEHHQAVVKAAALLLHQHGCIAKFGGFADGMPQGLKAPDAEGDPSALFLAGGLDHTRLTHLIQGLLQLRRLRIHSNAHLTGHGDAEALQQLARQLLVGADIRPQTRIGINHRIAHDAGTAAAAQLQQPAGRQPLA